MKEAKIVVNYQRAPRGPAVSPQVFNRLVQDLNMQKERNDRRFKELEVSIKGLEKRIGKVEGSK